MIPSPFYTLDIKIIVGDGTTTRYNIRIKIANISNQHIKHVDVSLIGSTNKLSKSVKVINPRSIESVIFPMENLPEILTCKVSCNGMKIIKNKIL